MTAMPLENIVFGRDWFESGWNRLLPRQAFALFIAVSTATEHDMDGDLKTLVVRQLGRWPWDMLGELDDPLRWTFDEQADDDEQVALDERRREVFDTAVAQAGRPVPTTVAELATLLADLGFFQHTITGVGERWRAPEVLPLPGEVLPLPADVAAELDDHRWQMRVEPYAQDIIRYVIDELGSPNEVPTSVDRLARALELDPQSVREGLGALLDHGDFRTVRDIHGRRNDIDPATLPDHARFTLVVDWERFAESRTSIQTA
jgi:hypothetical protein